MVAAFAALVFVGCNILFEDMCGNDVLRAVPSPDGNVKAVVFERNCGATTGFSEQVSLLASGARLPNRGGDTFVADGDHGAAPGGPQVQAVWTDDGHLLIKHHPRARIFHAKKRVRVGLGGLRSRTVTVTYAK
jgi:hypothetical protein